jgi:hypothetical protein
MGNTIWIGVVGAVIGAGVGDILSAALPGVGTFLAIACGAGIYYCNWWLNIRLICLGGDRSAIGAIYNVEPATPSYDSFNLGAYDTDYSFNLLLYPAIPIDMLPNWFVDNFSPPQAWNVAAPEITGASGLQGLDLQSQWPTLFPTINWSDANLILPQQAAMGSLGLGFTGQYAWPQGTSSTKPFISIIVSATDLKLTNGSTLQLKVTGYRADGSYQDLTQVPNAVTWTSSSPVVTISSTGLATADSSLVGSAIVSAQSTSTPTVSGATNISVIPGTSLAAGPWEQMLIHCEIEGRGMYDFRTLLYALCTVFSVATVCSFFPPIGTAIALILMLIALLVLLFGGPVIQNEDAEPPNPSGSPQGGDGWGGYAYGDAPLSNSPVDLVYVLGRWVFDSLHQPSGSNELHPVHYVVKVGTAPMSGLTTGDWGIDLGSMKTKYDDKYAAINAPDTVHIQSKPELQFSLHPLLDGCLGSTFYAPPNAPPPPQ